MNKKWLIYKRRILVKIIGKDIKRFDIQKRKNLPGEGFR